MNKKDDQLLKKLIMEHFLEKEINDIKNSSKKLTLAEPPFSWEEVYDALNSMLEKKTTMGDKVKKFEKMFAKYIGVKHEVCRILQKQGPMAEPVNFFLIYIKLERIDFSLRQSPPR